MMKSYIKNTKENQFISKAVALKYDTNVNSAPIVKSKGRGEIAKKIIQIAKEHDIPIKEDLNLIELLMQINLNEEIPPELYKVVAEIFAFIYNLKQIKS